MHLTNMAAPALPAPPATEEAARTTSATKVDFQNHTHIFRREAQPLKINPQH